MRRASAALVIALLVAAASCGEGGAGARARELVGALDETRANDRTFQYVDETLDGEQRIVVDGKVVDDLLYSGTVSLNDKKLFQAVVSDDSVAIKLLDVERTKPAIDAAEKADKITADALRSGRWVIDHTVAPPLLAAAAAPVDEEETADKPTSGGGRNQNLVGDDPFTDSAQILNYVERAVRSGVGVEVYNPEDIQYNPLDDPWRDDKDVNLRDQGIQRFDALTPPLPARAERGKQQSLPQIEHFRKMAIYKRGEEVVEIREQISIADRREFRRAESGRAADYYLRLRDAALGGALSDELRERRMTYKVLRVGGVDVNVPGDAVKGILADAVVALKAIFDFKFIGGSGLPTIPGASPLPAASPAGDSSPPAATAAP
jgi:hypothetical protein